MNLKRIILTPLFIIGVFATALADGVKGDPEIANKVRVSADFQIKLVKGLKLNLEPEFRFYEGFDKLHLNGGLTYKTFGCVYWGATYRLVVDRYESGTTTSMFGGGSTTNYDSEASHRFAFDVTYKEKFGRFTPSFRFRYNNYADDDIEDESYLRYRAKVEYNIRKCRFTPNISAEAYQDLSKNMIYKMRYTAGVDLKTGKKSSIGFDYKLDYFLLKYKNINIFSFGYKQKL